MALNKSHGYLPRRALTYTAASTAADVDALRAADTPPTIPTVHTGVALDGALDEDKVYMRVPTVTTTASVGAFNVTDFVLFTGLDARGRTRIVKVKLIDTDGGETVRPLAGDNPAGIGIDKVTSITDPGQLLAAGTIAFGVDADIEFDKTDPPVSVEAGAGAGTAILEDDGGDQVTLTLPADTLREGRFHKLIATSTADPIIVRL